VTDQSVENNQRIQANNPEHLIPEREGLPFTIA
jgi:hypothetical protein